ncbi:MAG: cyclase family protein, partial [Deltaproteobacteria bacterium]|nr:cyclase family protein [Deltaproteobacteria bacterium]
MGCARPRFLRRQDLQRSRRGWVVDGRHVRESRRPRPGRRDQSRRPARSTAIHATALARKRYADVLLDLPRFTRQPWLENGTRIRPVDLDACAEAFGVTVEPGDTVLVRTGMMARCLEQQSWAGYFGGPAPGLSALCARWIYEREIAAIATDTWGVEVRPYETPDCSQPLHLIAVRNMGLLIGEVFDLDALADACAEDQRYEFLFTAASLP